MKTFSLIFLVSSLLLTQANLGVASQPNPNQETITAQIQTLARIHVQSDQELQTATILNIFSESNLSKPEIALIYEQEYFKLIKPKIEKAEFLGNASIVVIGILLIVGSIVLLSTVHGDRTFARYLKQLNAKNSLEDKIFKNSL